MPACYQWNIIQRRERELQLQSFTLKQLFSEGSSEIGLATGDCNSRHVRGVAYIMGVNSRYPDSSCIFKFDILI